MIVKDSKHGETKKMALINKRKGKILMIPIVTLLLIIILVLIILPPGFGKTKPFVDEQGEIIKGSISEKIFVDINDTTLGMFIMAKDSNKPVLLFLGGGPGIPEYFLEQEFPAGLEDEFVVCYLEYRGTSLSYNSNISAETMTSEQYVSDAIEVTNYLRERFNKNKIYLMGHSFGTYVGILAASQHPELYNAYIAMSQVADQKESELLAYTYMYDQYQASGNSKMMKQFEAYPIKSSDQAYEDYSGSLLRDKAMHELGIGTTHTMHSVITEIFFRSLRCTVYTQTERINIWRGKSFAQETSVALDSAQFKAIDTVPELEIPVYFLAGIYDYTCCYSLQKEYYEQVHAPLKAFYTFNNSAHSPLYEEPDKALNILRQDILLGTNTLSD